MRTEEAWLDRFDKQEPRFTLEKACGPSFWRSVLFGCLPNEGMEELLGLSRANHFCFYGPEGTGKHSFAEAFAGSMYQHGYSYYHVYGSDFGEGTDAIERLDRFFEKTAGSPCVIVIEQIQNDKLWNRVSDICIHIPPESPMNVVILEGDDFLPQKRWMRRILFCRFNLPDAKEREAFFEDPRYAMPRKNGEPSSQWLAGETEGFSYIQLKQMVRILLLQLKAEAVERFHGDDNIAYEAYQKGEFYYTKGQFEEAVGLVRSSCMPASPKESGADAPPIHLYLNGTAFNDTAGTAPGSVPVERKEQETDERLKAEQELFAELNW